MKLGSRTYRVKRWIAITGLCGGGMLFTPFSGCEPAVQSTILGGLNDLSVTLVDAFFLTLAPTETITTTGT